MKTLYVFPNATSKGASDNMMTFPEFVNFLRADFFKTRPLDDADKLILLTDVFQNHLNKGSGYFSALSGSGLSGTVSNLIMLFDQLKQSLISSETFRKIIALTAGNKEKNIELSCLYSKYERLLAENNLTDSFDHERQALEVLLDDKKAKKILGNVSNVRFENLYNPSLLRFEIIRALAARVGNIKVAIPYNADRQDAFSFLSKTVMLFEQLNVEETQCYEPKDIFTIDYGQRRPFIDDIMRHIFKSPAELADICLEPDESSISIAASQSIQCEVKQIGRRIKKLLREGADPRKIGVVFRSLTIYGKYCENVFRKYQIPVVFRRGEPLSGMPLTRMIFSILDTARGNLNSDRVLGLLRSSYTNFRDKFNSLKLGDIELIILHSGIIDDTGDGWERKIDRFEENLRKGITHKIEPEKVSEMKTILCPLLKKLRRLRKGMTYKDFFAGLLDLVAYLGISENIKKGDEPAIIERDTASLNTVNEMIKNCLYILKLCGRAEDYVPLDDFYGFLLRAAKTKTLPAEKSHINGVHIVNPYDAIGLKFDFLFLGGLVEGEFPEPKYDNPLFTDLDKREFNRALREQTEKKGLLKEISAKRAFRETEDRFMEEPLLFCLALACVRKKIYLSYSELDEAGSGKLPSTLLKALLRLMERRGEDGTKEELWQKVFCKAPPFPLPDYEDAGNSLEFLSKLMEEMSFAGKTEAEIRTKDTKSLDKELSLCIGNARAEEERDKFSQEHNPEKRGELAGAYTGRIIDEGLLENIRELFLAGDEIHWSALLLEEFAEDPFAFYLKRILKLSEQESPTIEPRAITAGSIAHKILKRFFESLPGGNALCSDAQLLTEKAIEKTFSELRSSGEIADESFWRIKEREIKKSVYNFIIFEKQRCAMGGEPLPSLYEFAFGKGETSLSLRFKGLPPLRIHGRIDRVDLDEEKKIAVVYDYKYSASGRQMEAVREALIGRTRFQLGVYLLAVMRYLRWEEPYALKAGIYLLRNNPASPKKYYKELEFNDEIMKALREGIEKIVRLVISGRFDGTMAGD